MQGEGPNRYTTNCPETLFRHPLRNMMLLKSGGREKERGKEGMSEKKDFA